MSICDDVEMREGGYECDENYNIYIPPNADTAHFTKCIKERVKTTAY